MAENIHDEIAEIEARRRITADDLREDNPQIGVLLNKLPSNFINKEKEVCVLTIIKNNGKWIVSYVRFTTAGDRIQYTFQKKHIYEALLCMTIRLGIK